MTEFIKKDTASLFTNSDFVVGSIKSLEDLYNIDVLIKAFHILYTKLDTGEDYNINSRNIDILKWAKDAVEEITGNIIVKHSFSINDIKVFYF